MSTLGVLATILAIISTSLSMLKTGFLGHRGGELGAPDPSVRYHLCLWALPMGDLNSVDIAQSVHESLLTAHGCLQPDQRLMMVKPVGFGKTLEGVYIDDHLVCIRYCKAGPCPPAWS